jgi:60 kDa SS-A/Ro ribonucleoprotein
MSKYGTLFTTQTPQSSPIKGRETSMAKNNAGGFTFTLSKWQRLERFLILGSDSNTYYQKAPRLTKENASVVNECWTENAQKTAAIIDMISVEGRAPKNSPAIFALALGAIHKDVDARREAFASMPIVCRTSTHLFEFVSTCKQLGKGWGRLMATSVAKWYSNKTDDQLAYQLVKYRQREGYTHERLIRLAHPGYWDGVKISPSRGVMYDWLRGREVPSGALPDIIRAHVAAMSEENAQIDSDAIDPVGHICELIQEFNLPWEALPTWANTKPEVWRAMLPKMPLTAMIRNLANMTRLGVFSGLAGEDHLEIVAKKLVDDRALVKARIHPFNVLNALHTYNSGKGFRGGNSWTPIRAISETLNYIFYKSFGLIKPSNKRIMLALDVSGSMEGAKLFNSNLSAREASAAMAMATLRSEERVEVTAFTFLRAHNYGAAIIDFPLDRNLTLEQVVQKTRGLPHAGTDCSLPMLYAMQEKKNIDAFVIYTDNETWAGQIHAVEALQRYRQQSGIEDAKLIVVGMTSTGFSIADPNDPYMLDVVGFDSNAPAIISDFIRGSSSQEHAQDQADISGYLSNMSNIEEAEIDEN